MEVPSGGDPNFKLNVPMVPIHRELPQELIDHIIDNLSENKEDLKTSSLVSKSWAHRSHSNLHRSVRLTAEFGKTNIFRYTSPHIANYVRNIVIKYRPHHNSCCTDPMWTLASRFQNAENLQVFGLDHYLLPYRWRPVFQAMCSRLTSLTLHTVAFYDKETFFTLLGAAEFTLNLVLIDISFKHSHPFDVRSGADIPMKRLLKRLEIGHHAIEEPGVNEALSQWLSVLRNGALQDVSWYSRKSSDHFPLICTGIGSAPLNLEISPKYSLPAPEHTGIQHCTRLRSITFHFDSTSSQRTTIHKWVTRILGQLPSPNRSLTRVTFVDDRPVDEAVACLEALKVDDVLAEGRFERLEEIVVSLRLSPLTVAEVLKELNRVFEKAVSRHVLLRVTDFTGGGGGRKGLPSLWV